MRMDLPHDDLIRAYAANFLGYGTWTAPFWFVGMEEGGGQSLTEFALRVQAWIDEGQPELLDLASHQKRISETASLSPAPSLQRTWGRLIRAFHVAHGVDDPSRETLRTYQQTRLGRSDGETALLELLPFPSANTRDWLYTELGIPEYATRKKYRATLRPFRVQRITERIRRHQPRVAVFYGNSRYWRDQLSLRPLAMNTHHGQTGKTLLIATPHPTAYGTTNAQWDEIGRIMRDAAAARQR
jgi:hypothetical protein